MQSDSSEPRLRELMGEMRQTDATQTPSFSRTWNAAVRKAAPERQIPLAVRHRFAWSAAAALILFAALWFGRNAQERQRRAQDYAMIDSVLLTYWQPPTDSLLEPARASEGAARP